MRKVLLGCAAIIASTCIVGAQDYSPIVADREAYYVVSDGMGSRKVDAIRLDSVGVSGNFISYQDYRREVASPMWSQSCLTFADTGWVGHSILVDFSSASSVFFNEQNDSIHFYHFAGIGQVGMLYVFPNGDKIEGTVVSTAASSFMSITDSVKTMSLQAFDATSTPIANDFNAKTIQLSKTRGLVRAYNWKKFPTDTLAYVLSGMNNPQEGIANQDAASIYDYTIGDRFDFETQYNSNAMSGPTTYSYSTRIVTGKTISSNADTITYTYLEDFTQKIGSTIVQQYSGQTVVQTIILSFDNATYDMDLLPVEFADAPDTNSGYGATRSGWPYDATLYNGRQQKSYTYDMWWYYSQDSSCYFPANLSWGPCDGTYREWAQGVGQVYARYGSVTCFGYYYLRYFDKGTDVWGTPHNWNVINAVPAHGAGSLPAQVWPNPATNVLNVNLAGFSGTEVTYQIYTITGQLLTEGVGIPIGGTLQMPVNQISGGIYTVVVSSESNVWTGRFVK